MDILFNDTEIAFRDKSTYELKRARLLFRLMSHAGLVRAGAAGLRLVRRLRIPYAWALRSNVFAHFCGGQTIEDCHKAIRRLEASGVLTILDYSAEGKEQEEDFETSKQEILATIRLAVNDSAVPYAVFKPTGLAPFALLEKIQSSAPLSADEKISRDLFLARIESIAGLASETGVPVMVDAEESWIQSGVDELVEDLMFRFNKEKPLIFTTLQMYRHDRLDYLKSLVVRARAKGVFTAVKLVRGAYMEKERARAAELEYTSPIHSDKEATDRAFDQAVRFCLENLGDVAVCIGSHNEYSHVLATAYMAENNIPAGHPHVSFAQLLGMSDHISYRLAADGYRVCKYMPYGPVETVLPYLIRRAEENTSVAGQTGRELFLLNRELVRRKALSDSLKTKNRNRG